MTYLTYLASTHPSAHCPRFVIPHIFDFDSHCEHNRKRFIFLIRAVSSFNDIYVQLALNFFLTKNFFHSMIYALEKNFAHTNADSLIHKRTFQLEQQKSFHCRRERKIKMNFPNKLSDDFPWNNSHLPFCLERVNEELFTVRKKKLFFWSRTKKKPINRNSLIWFHRSLSQRTSAEKWFSSSHSSPWKIVIISLATFWILQNISIKEEEDYKYASRMTHFMRYLVEKMS